jgi:hypothetical protein
MKNQVKKFSEFINEGYYYSPETGKDLRKELIGGKGQKAQYDELTDDQKEGLEATFKSLLTLDPETAKHFVRSISRFNSIEEISDELHNISLKSARGGEWNIGGAYGEEEEDEPEWNIGR